MKNDVKPEVVDTNPQFRNQNIERWFVDKQKSIRNK